MKKIKKILFMLIAISFGIGCSEELKNSDFEDTLPPLVFPEDGGGIIPTPDPEAIRVVSYNIKHCAGGDDVINYERVANVLKDLNAHVICLQEVDYKTTRSNGVDQLAKLAELLGMQKYYAKAIDFQNGGYGNGVLTTETPISKKAITLPGKEARSVAFVEFDTYVVASTHLDLNEAQRVASIEHINSQAKSYGKPVYIAGDFNESDLSGPFFTTMQNNWTIASRLKKTFPANAPRKVIDFIMTLNGFADRVITTDVIHTLKEHNIGMTSDHCPLYCDLIRPKAKSEYPKADGAVRIATYFANKCMGGDGVINYDRVAGVIAGSKADIICLQGIHDKTTTSSGVDQMAELAARTGLKPYFSPAIEYKGGHFGNGILTTETPINTAMFNYKGVKENRTAMMAEYEKFVVISTSFDQDMSKRIEMIDGLTAEAKKLNKAVYLAGYFNDQDFNSDFMNKVRENWAIISSDEATQHTTSRRLDFILSLKTFTPTVDKAAAITSLSGVDVVGAAKHYPTFCDIMGSMPAGGDPQAKPTARIASYFANYCGGTDKVIDYNRIATVIKSIDADVFCLQGMDNKTTRSKGVDQTSKLAELTGMHPHFSAGEAYKGGYYGNGILTKDTPLSTDAYAITISKSVRSVMCVEYARFVVKSTFFDPNEQNRITALEEITTKAKAYGKPVLLVGYFNDDSFDKGDAQSAFALKVRENWDQISPMSVTQHTSDRVLDFVFVLKNKTVDVKSCNVVTSLPSVDLKVASKHYPLSCELQNLNN